MRVPQDDANFGIGTLAGLCGRMQRSVAIDRAGGRGAAGLAAERDVAQPAGEHDRLYGAAHHRQSAARAEHRGLVRELWGVPHETLLAFRREHTSLSLTPAAAAPQMPTM